MNLAGPIGVLATALLSAGYLVPASLLAQGATNPSTVSRSHSAPAVPTGGEPGTPIDLPPLPPGELSPITFFRELLAMNEAERALALSAYTPERRAQILAKVGEYESLTPDDREVRLRVTELSWYLRPLMTTPSPERAQRLAGLPEPNRTLLAKRLSDWDKLPAEVKRELLGLGPTLPYIAEVGGRSKLQRQQILNSLSPERRSSLEQGLQKWDAMSEAERQRTLQRFNQFFNLTAAEKIKALRTLSDPERQQIEMTMQTFGSLTEDQRAWCIRSFEKFASLSPEEREEFLKNAERWKLMPPSERQAWRELVSIVPPPVPNFPPLPPPPLPPVPDTPALVTNRN